MRTGRRIAAAVAALAALASGVGPASAADFDRRDVPVQPTVINDLGIADIDGDRDADIYSTNHSNPSSFLLNAGGWSFIDSRSSLGLDQTPQAPSWNRLSEAPAMGEPGLYIWAGWDNIEIRSTDGAKVASGQLSLYSPVEATTTGGGEVEIVQGGGNPPPTAARFTIPGGGGATLRYTTPGHSFESTILTIDETYPLERVHVGAAGEVPGTREVELHLHDRHAIVWGQFDGDRRPDAFIVRGGLKRSVYGLDRRPTDELLVRENDRFRDRAQPLGLGSQVCSAREARQIDLGGGMGAEVLVACRSGFPRIYRRDLFGFKRVSVNFPKQIKNASWYLPFDLGGKSRRVLIIRRKSKAYLVKTGRYRWRVIQTVRLRSKGNSRRNHKRIARGDLDGDGDMDAFVPDADGSTVLVNKGGRLVSLSAKSRGLPHGSTSATMVDFDLDGRLDLHLLPQGLYRQTRRNRFAFEDAPELSGTDSAADVSSSWADLDGDLDLDALIGEHRSGEDWDVWAAEYVGERGNAIGVHAIGPIENAVSFGARVTVLAGKRRLRGWIGQNNTNSFSQGNYDLVFGLGGRERVKKIVVVWPDGSRTARRGLAAGTSPTFRYRR